MGANGFPMMAEVQARLERFADGHQRIARPERLGLSPEGRQVLAVRVTDPDMPDDDKQAAMAVCGRHGNEPGGPAVGLAVLDWLAAPPLPVIPPS